MGLGLPDGGHLTHGYYVSWFHAFLGCVGSFRADSQEEDDRVVDLLPVIPVRARPRHAAC
jgi:hypothetical protein